MESSPLKTQLRIAILGLPGIGIAKAPKILAALDGAVPESAVDFVDQIHDAASAKRIKEFSHAEVELAFERASRIVNESSDAGIRILTEEDPVLPATFWRIPKAPFVMYARGNTSELATRARVAVIGTREPTEWGLSCGRRIAKTLASQDICIVSGLAIGCDTAGHEGCLDAGGITVAVMAHGLDEVHPAANRELAARIADEGGCLLSEYPIGHAVRPNQYVDRDRLQSALCDALFVVETDIRGGTMHTVRFAKDQGRMIGCLEHPPERRTSPKTRGTLQLIEDGDAIPVRDEESLSNFIDRINQRRADGAALVKGGQHNLFGD